jgi:hypothetical protein
MVSMEEIEKDNNQLIASSQSCTSSFLVGFLNLEVLLPELTFSLYL